MIYRIVFAFCIGVGWPSLCGAVAAPQTFSPGDLLIDEFFNGWHRVDPATGQATPLPYLAPTPVTDDVVVDHNGHAIFAASHGFDLYDLDLTTQQTSLILTLPNGIDGITLSNTDQLFVATDNEVVSIDRANHTFQSLPNPTFYNPQAIVFNPSDGNLYVSEFFNDLWRINLATHAATRVSVPAGIGAFWDDLVVLPNGNLVAFNNNSPQLTRIVPGTGSTSVFTTELPPFPMRTMATDANGDVIVTAASSIFRYDRTNGARSTLTPGTTFFSPHGIALVPVSVTMVPEPATLAPAFLLGSFVILGRLRSPRR